MPDSPTETTEDFNHQISALDADFLAATRSAAQLGKTLTAALEGIAFKGKSLGDTFQDLALSISQSVFRAAFQPLQSDLSSIFTGLFKANSVLPFAKGGAFQSGMPVPFASGGIIASPISFPLADGRTGIAGERGAEAIMPLTRGPDGRLGIATAGTTPPSITVNITATDIDSFRRSETQVASMLARAVAQGQRNL